MRLSPEEGLARLAAHDHGVLATVHPERGVDAVPCVYAVDDDGHVAVPVDRVKPKSGRTLQREHNLAADPRATLLVQHWDAGDWSRLWWVRAELRRVDGGDAARLTPALSSLLAARYPQYEDEPFDRVVVLRTVGVTGWAASG